MRVPETNSIPDQRSQIDGREPVSAFVISFNEEDQIAECIKSVRFCDEIIVVDSYSTDQTPQIARDLGAQVVQRPWLGYRDQKAFGLSLTNNEWVINLDADERVSEELRESILKILKSDRQKAKKEDAEVPLAGNPSQKDEIVGYYVNRVVFYLGRWWRRGGWYPEYRLRFFRKSFVTWGGVDPHEKAFVQGKTRYLTGELQHYTYKNLNEQLERLHNFSTVAAEQDFTHGRKCGVFLLLFAPWWRMVKFYILKKGYREGMPGLVVAIIEGYYTFLKYAKLWEHHFMKGNRSLNS